MNLTSAVSLEFRLSICPTLDTEETPEPPEIAVLLMLFTVGILILRTLLLETAWAFGTVRVLVPETVGENERA